MKRMQPAKVCTRMLLCTACAEQRDLYLTMLFRQPLPPSWSSSSHFTETTMPSAARTACAVLAAAVATSLTVVEAHPKIFWGKYDVPQCKTFFTTPFLGRGLGTKPTFR